MANRLSTQGRLFLLSLLLLMVIGGGLTFTLEQWLNDWVNTQLEEELLEKARVTALAVEGKAPEELSPLADVLGEALQGRVTLISASGEVLGDSERSDEALYAMDNHKDRPEVVAANQDGVGVAWRFSDTLQHEMLYVAVSMSAGGVVRVAVPTSELFALSNDLRTLFILSTLLGVLVTFGMSFLASRWVSRDLQSLIQQARQTVESGSGRLTVTGRRELGGLVGAFNKLAASLEVTVGDLERERDRLGSILEGLGEAVLALDSQQRITLLNPAAVSLFQFAESPHGQSLFEVLPDTTLQGFIEELHGLEPQSTEFSLTTPSGTGRQILVTATPQSRSDGGCLLVCRDVTNLRRLERMRRDFVANVSHELRTPVAIIRINAETLIDGAISDPEHGPRFVEGIYRNAERLTRLLTDLLDLSQLEAGRYQLSTASYHLAPAAAQAFAQVHHKAEERNQTITMNIKSGLKARCDLPALEQVLTNLLDNAVKYCPPGTQIKLRAIHEKKRNQVRIEVVDNGPGIAEKHHARLFERFYRVDPGRSRDMGGTGLGLSIVRHLVESMHGRIGVSSVMGKGTTFWILLPTKKKHPIGGR